MLVASDRFKSLFLRRDVTANSYGDSEKLLILIKFCARRQSPKKIRRWWKRTCEFVAFSSAVFFSVEFPSWRSRIARTFFSCCFYSPKKKQAARMAKKNNLSVFILMIILISRLDCEFVCLCARKVWVTQAVEECMRNAKIRRRCYLRIDNSIGVWFSVESRWSVIGLS